MLAAHLVHLTTWVATYPPRVGDAKSKVIRSYKAVHSTSDETGNKRYREVRPVRLIEGRGRWMVIARAARRTEV
jgi:predicted DNA-binding transcriptional regulator YafY